MGTRLQMNAMIEEAYQAAMKSGKYDSVKRWGVPGQHRHYACTNHWEYFAEMSEAFWSSARFRGDYEPFTRAELVEFDPQGGRVCELVWGVSVEEVDARTGEQNRTDQRVSVEEVPQCCCMS